MTEYMIVIKDPELILLLWSWVNLNKLLNFKALEIKILLSVKKKSINNYLMGWE